MPPSVGLECWIEFRFRPALVASIELVVVNLPERSLAYLGRREKGGGGR